MEVRDDPVRPAELVVEHDRAEEDAGDAADDEQEERAQREQERRREAYLPLQHRVDEREHHQVERQGDADGGNHKERLHLEVDARQEHVVHPDGEALDGDEHHREDEPLAADDAAAGERLEHLGHDAERREEDDVHLGVAEEPKQVGPQERAPPRRRIVVPSMESK